MAAAPREFRRPPSSEPTCHLRIMRAGAGATAPLAASDAAAVAAVLAAPPLLVPPLRAISDGPRLYLSFPSEEDAAAARARLIAGGPAAGASGIHPVRPAAGGSGGGGGGAHALRPLDVRYCIRHELQVRGRRPKQLQSRGCVCSFHFSMIPTRQISCRRIGQLKQFGCAGLQPKLRRVASRAESLHRRTRSPPAPPPAFPACCCCRTL